MNIAEPFEVGKVTISLDTELGWGRIDSARFDDIEDQLDHGREGIEKLLTLFNKYSIPVTWALVGQLFRKSRPNELDHGIVSLSTDSTQIPWQREWWRAPEVIAKIVDSETEHEIASHSGSHIPYDELSVEEAKRDVELFKEWSTSHISENATSFVFPQNRIAHLDVLREAGFQCYRGPPPLLGSDPSPTAFLPRRENGLINIPASIAYRQYEGRNRILRALPTSIKITGMRAAVMHAALRGRVCHVVLHPKDFMAEDGENLLSRIEDWVRFVSDKRAEGTIEVKTMRDIANMAEFDT